MNNRRSNKNKTKSKTYHTSPPRQSESFSMINCLTTKSENFVFD